ncbi:MAG: type II secretion system F family protein [Alphaproteobacteria bacterium]|nr:type II secretion system F family protein [Alphaproteobacteria bacterium]
MARSGENSDLELLRAIAHARMYVTSGRGLESVVFALVENRLGRVSQVLTPALSQMSEGEEAETAVRTVLDREPDPNVRAFLAALIASGKPGIMRLDELSQTLHTERESRAEIYGARLTGIVDMTAALFVFSFAPTILRVFTFVPKNGILPTLHLGSTFENIFYAVLAVVMTGLLAMARVK